MKAYLPGSPAAPWLFRSTLFLIMLWAAKPMAYAQTIRYVKAGESGTGTGSWSNASANLQDMINASSPGDQVWVAAGEYQPADGQSFSMKEGVKIYGGFLGNETAFTQRNAAPDTHKSILRGNNSRVITNTDLTNAAVIDGFTIKGGSNADGAGMNNLNASPSIWNCIFTQNHAGFERYGGGIYNYNSSPIIYNSVFTDNSGFYGGAISCQVNSAPKLYNCLIVNNSGTQGAGLYCYNATLPEFTNCTLSGNVSNAGMGGIYISQTGKPTFRNTIINGTDTKLDLLSSDPTIRLNCLLEQDPAFTDSADPDGADNIFGTYDDGFHIQSSSLARNGGSNAHLPATDYPFDLAGNPRTVGQNVDIGAYEYFAIADILIRYVKHGATGNGYTWKTASGDLQEMINASLPGSEVWVAAGEYQPEQGEYFSMKEGVKIFGGFSGTGTPAFADRNRNQYETVLKGNNSHVIRNDQNGLTSAAVLDGFTITGGSAQNGGGMFNNVAYPLVNHCIFRSNHASQWGGGIYNVGAGMTTIANSLFYRNTAQSGGAAFSNIGATPRFINVTMADNAADENGGALHNYQSAESELINTIVWNNTQAPSSSQLYTAGTGATKAYFSILEGGAEAIIGDKTTVDIISDDPLFVDPAGGDFRLQECSQGINAGTASLISGLLTTDLAGNDRIYGGITDLGAYEYQSAIQTGADRLAADGNVTTIHTEPGKKYYVATAGDACRSVAAIESKGTSPLSGNVVITTWIDEEVKTHNGSPYLQRHFDISPVSGSETATARVTLYFTQTEFDTFNQEISSGQLPTGPQDPTGRAHLRVYQYHGAPSVGNGPGSYHDGLTTIDKDKLDILWNYGLARWEVSFEVTGFSGFFVGSGSSPLPVRLVSFNGRPAESNAVQLEWKVAEQRGIAAYVVERSADARNFVEIGRVAADEAEQAAYHFRDARAPDSPLAYYRLRVLENDGSFSMSGLISIGLSAPGIKIVAYPVPAREVVWLKGAAPGSELRLVDMGGRLLKTIRMLSEEAALDISQLPAGTYLLQPAFGKVLKVVKE